MDRALKTNRGRSRMVSAAIIALGVLILAGVLLFRDRGRERAAGSVRVGDDSTSVAARLGKNPQRCTEINLGHLADAFPANTPRPTVEETLGGLHGRTTTRWVYAGKQRTPCRARRGDTEVGFDREGKVLWAVPVYGTTPIVM
ncbi:MAG TPA: hypothetical protein VF647_05575 [Longimicrobium sp.]